MALTVERTLPARPDLEQQKKRAKALLKAIRAGEPQALARLASGHPRHVHRAPADLGAVKLADAQVVIAREYGFSSWPALKAHIDGLSREASPQRPFETDPQYYRDRAFGLASVKSTGERGALRIIRRHHPAFAAASEGEIDAAPFTQADAELVVAREHGFADFAALEARLADLRGGAAREPFRDAFKAIKAGDEAALAAVLDAQPDLVQALGTNGNSLLSLAVAFGRDGMIETLLARGADPNLVNNKGANALHNLAAGGRAEGELARAERLIAAGTSVEAEAYGEGGSPLALALFWGKRALAERLARESVTPLNLRIAAGLGRVELLDALAAPDGGLLPEAGRAREFHRPHSGFPPWRPADERQQILDEALTYAARNGRVEAMDWLVRRGADVDAEPYNGTALVWAVRQDRLEAIGWLIAHGADPNRPCGLGGPTWLTPLHAAAAWEGRPEAARLLLRLGADSGLSDPAFKATPAGWADHFGNADVKAVLESGD
ncbi:MAG TPA: ankyrin repeat domain-containing protein [Caulobacteraceae bacterium]|nr:ankyrin repeat domain-containing protein [Caulobacteraceae bacterium]